MAANAFLSTSKVTGSSRLRVLILIRSSGRWHGHTDVQPLIDLDAYPGRHDGRGIELIDHGRALERGSRREDRAIEHGRVYRLIDGVEQHGTAFARCQWPCPVGGIGGELGLLDRA